MTLCIQQKKFGSIWPMEALILHNFLLIVVLSGLCVKPKFRLSTWLFHLIHVRLHISKCPSHRAISSRKSTGQHRAMPCHLLMCQCQLNLFANVSRGDVTSPSDVALTSQPSWWGGRRIATSSREVAMPTHVHCQGGKSVFHNTTWGGIANSSILAHPFWPRGKRVSTSPRDVAFSPLFIYV